MAKYSIDSDNTSERSEEELAEGGTCELCGDEVNTLYNANIEGATLEVCIECSPRDDNTKEEESRDNESANKTKDMINRTTPNADNVLPDSSWAEEGVGYDSEPLPYLVKNYGEVVRDAREDRGLTQEELAEEVGVGLNIIRVIEQGQAASRDVGGTVIEALEEELDVQIEEE